MIRRYRNKWVKALKGDSLKGVYTKAISTLLGTIRKNGKVVEDCFCGLGVLVNECGDGFDSNGHAYVDGKCQGLAWLDKSGLEFFGLTEDEQRKATRISDNGSMRSFRKLANWIEKNL